MGKKPTRTNLRNENEAKLSFPPGLVTKRTRTDLRKENEDKLLVPPGFVKRRMRSDLRNENEDKFSTPPGFASLTSFRLKRVGNSELSTPSMIASKGKTIHMDAAANMTGDATLERSFQHRLNILHDQKNHNQVESESEQVEMDLSSKSCLPKGVARGCPDCSNCLKVTARWHPEDARRDVLEEVPVFHPTEEEFKDTLKYIASIRLRAERYGICRIVPPHSWQPPCVIKEKNIWESAPFETQIQRIDGLQPEHVQRELARIHEHLSCKRNSFTVDMEHDKGDSVNADGVGCSSTDGFAPEAERKFTLESFKKYADDFKNQYFCASNAAVSDVVPDGCSKQWEPSLENIEGEYRRIVENPTEEIEVLYGRNLDTRVFGSGFPTKSNTSEADEADEYLDSGWNLNNIPRLSGSLLSFESNKTCDVLVPQLNIGMCFSSFCWKVEEHRLYSLCYMHLGAPKIWYGVPGRYAVKFKAAMEKCLPDLLAELPKLHDRVIAKPSTSALKSEDIPVYHCIQHPGEFVLVFPGAYYSGFDSGFNCSEIANVAPLEWLPHGQQVVEVYSEQRKKTSVSQDKLLLGAAKEAVRAHREISLLKTSNIDSLRWQDAIGEDGILARALKTRVKMEDNIRKCLFAPSQSQKMDKNFDAVSKRECSICFYDLYLSAVCCSCSMDRYSCMYHVKQLCSCAWSEKIYLFRHDISQLNILIEGVEGKLNAAYRWAREELKMSLHSFISKDGSQAPNHDSSPGVHSEKLKERMYLPQRVATPCSSVGSTVSRIMEEVKARVLLKDAKKNSKVSTVVMSEKNPTKTTFVTSEQKPRESPKVSGFVTGSALNDAPLMFTCEVSSGSTSSSSSSDSEEWDL